MWPFAFWTICEGSRIDVAKWRGTQETSLHSRSTLPLVRTCTGWYGSMRSSWILLWYQRTLENLELDIFVVQNQWSLPITLHWLYDYDQVMAHQRGYSVDEWAAKVEALHCKNKISKDPKKNTSKEEELPEQAIKLTKYNAIIIICSKHYTTILLIQKTMFFRFFIDVS